jgi:hypothetical protein
MAMIHTRAEVETDMRETLGLVPTFFSRIPGELLEHEWAIFKPAKSNFRFTELSDVRFFVS